jgi:ribosomal protein S18 acetylase RimI-like enzyme
MIRQVQMDDIPFIQAYPGQMLGAHMLYEDIKKAIFVREDAHYFIYEDEEPKGYIGIHKDITQAEIVTVYVPKPFRQQKVATQLLEYVINLCHQAGIQMLSLEVSTANAPAIHLYEKFGFVKKYTRKNYYPDGSDADVMIKEL